MVLFDKYRKSSPNSKIVIKNTLGAFVVKGFALIVSLLTMPAFIHYFNNNVVLGVWFTMLSILIWFLNFDLGIGNGIRNQLVRDFASKDYDSIRCTLSSGFAAITVVTIVLSVVGIILISVINLNSLYNVDESLLSSKTLLISTGAIFLAIMLRFMLTAVSSIFYALQKSAINNFLALCVSILQLLYVLLFSFENVEEALINLSVAYIFLSNLPVIIAGCYVLAKPLKLCRPKLLFITKERIRSIMGIGVIFFFCQIAYMCIANTNEFLITKFYGAQYTADYTFYHKIMNVVSMIVTLAFTPIWSVVTKAVAEKDYVWLAKLYKIVKKVGFVIIVFQFIITPFMQPIMDFWLGTDQVRVNFWTSISFASFGSVFVYCGMLSTIVNGMTRIKLQALCYSFGVIIKFAIVIGLSNVFDRWDLVVWSNVVVMAPYAIAQHIDLNYFFKKVTQD